jgi:vacuolar-type H+-ATPase subunit F/Vma7
MRYCYIIFTNMQDTVTGFLLAGVGNSDIRKKTNFLVVDSSARFAATCVPSQRSTAVCGLATARHPVFQSIC